MREENVIWVIGNDDVSPRKKKTFKAKLSCNTCLFKLTGISCQKPRVQLNKKGEKYWKSVRIVDASEVAVMNKHQWVNGCADHGIHTMGQHTATRRNRIPMYATTGNMK